MNMIALKQSMSLITFKKLLRIESKLIVMLMLAMS